MRQLLVTLFSICLIMLPAAAQVPLPLPEPHRGLVSRAPFEIPSHLIPLTREPLALTVTRFDDPVVASCNTADGVSLREAIVTCSSVSIQPIIYLPSGTYTINSTITTNGRSFMLIGQDPATTTIQGAGSFQYFNITITAPDSLTFANLTLANASASVNGNALRINGSGTVNIDNVRIIGSSNTARGPLLFDTQSSGTLSVSISHSEFTGNSSTTDGGAVAFANANADGRGMLFIADSRFSGNSTVTNGGGLLVTTAASSTTDISIENTTFESNSTGNQGGAIVISGDNTTLNIIDSTIRGNSAKDGGGVWFQSSAGMFAARNSEFVSNTSSDTGLGGGGALYVHSAHSVLISDSLFEGNSSSSSGGAMKFETDVRNIVFTDTTVRNNSAKSAGGIYVSFADSVTANRLFVVGNTATNQGGGAIIVVSRYSSFTDSVFELNTAVGVGGIGGLFTSNATLLNVRIENNSAQFSPDCRFNAIAGTVTSLGGVSITDMSGCIGTFIRAPGDLIGNLLVNGGFETAGATKKQAAGWTLKQGSGDARACNKPNKPNKAVTTYGQCAFQFKGGPGETATLVQNVNLTGLTFTANEILTIYAMGDGSSAASKLKVIVKAAYSDQPKTKSAFNINGNHPKLTSQSQILQLASANVTKLTVQIKHTSTSGKYILDRVFLVRPS